MKRGIRIIATLALCLTLGLSTAWAQEQEQQQDDFLQRYDLALENLATSVDALPESGSIAREELDQAVNALRTLARGTESTALITAMERIFERAREAIANQSNVDLAVQVEVLRGGFQRLVYNAALQSAIEGDLETARVRLLEIGADVGVSESAMAALANPERTIAELRYALEAGVAGTVRAKVATAQERATTDLDDAYRILADAYGDYLLVQDSPRLPANVNATFVAAADALVDTQVDELSTQLDTLQSSFTTLEQASGSALATAPGADPVAPSEPTELPATQTAQPTEPVEDPADTQEAAEPATDDTAPAEGEAAATETQTATPAEIAAQVAAEIAEQERADQIEALEGELAAAGVTEERRSALAAQILDAEYTSLEDVVRDLYADAAEAANAIELGQPDAARGFVRVFSERYRQVLAPIVATTAPQTDLRTTALTSKLATVDGIRLQDVATLASQAGALREVLSGNEPAASHRAAADTVRFWAGLPRLIAVIVFGLLAFVPLYLLNLAFGGGNRNWRLVGVALFLLLVPVIYEALAFVGDLLAGATGIDAFYAIGQFSMFHHPVSQVVWLALTALAILFAIGGLYGICVQFGLLGRRSGTQTSTTEVRDTVEWDEEF